MGNPHCWSNLHWFGLQHTMGIHGYGRFNPILHSIWLPIGCGPRKTCDEITPSSTMVYGLRAGRDSQRNQPWRTGISLKRYEEIWMTILSEIITVKYAQVHLRINFGGLDFQPVNLSGQKWVKLLRYTCIEWMDGWSLFRDDHGGFVPSKPLRGWLDALRTCFLEGFSSKTMQSRTM